MQWRTVSAVLALVVLVGAVGCIQFKDAETGNTDAAAHLSAGYDANDQGDWATAIDEYSRALEIEPSARGYVGRAYAYGSTGDEDAAIADLTEAIKLDDRSAAAFSQRALYYNRQERWSEALTDLNRAIQLRPERGDQYNGRALAHLHLGNLEQAVEDATTAIELDPDPERLLSYYTNRATAYWELGETDLALADLEHIAVLTTSPAGVDLEVAFLLGRIGAVDEGLQRLESIPGLAESPAGWHAMRSEVFKRAEQFRDALAEVNQAIELDPESPLLLAGRGTIYEALGEVELARGDYEHALTLTDDPFVAGEIEGRLSGLEDGR